MEDKVKKTLLIAGLGVSLSASAALLYYLLKREDDDYSFSKNVLTTRQSLIRVKIPKEMIGSVIGRQGATIKDLQEKTNTRIRFEKEPESALDNDQDRELIIRGSPDDAQEAENLINEIIHAQSEIFVEEIFVPVRACGRIIGRSGENIRHMCYVSKAKINVERGGDERDPDNMKRVTIRGSKEEIKTAVLLLDEKLAEDEDHRNRIFNAAGRLTRYASGRLAINFNDGPTSPDTLSNRDIVRQERLEVSSTDGFAEVYISGVDHPGHFWVQIVGPKSVDLDKLIEDMTDYYEIKHNCVPANDNVKIGDIVAAPFKQDKSWYRGRVEEILIDEYCPEETKVKLYFVDFGDSENALLKNVCILTPEFNDLTFQAIECAMAKIKPVNDTWSEEACDAFEKLSYAAQWKVIMAKPVTSVKPNENSNREVFYVELVDTNNKKDINIAKQMVKQNFAVWDKIQTGENK